MTENGSVKRQNPKNNGHTGNGSKTSSVLSIVFGAVIAFLLLGAVIYSLDRRSTLYSKVAVL